MPLSSRFAATFVFAVVLVACAASPIPSPTAAPTKPTTQATTAPTAAATAAPSPAANASATPASPGAATPSSAPSVAPDHVRYVVVPAESEARYRVKEQLAGRDLPNDAVGTTKAVSGQIVVDSAGKVVKDASKITVNLSSLKSDQGRRDAFLSQNTLETARHPEVVFVPTEIRGLPSPLPTSGEVTFDLVGDLTVKGVTKPTTWKVEARVDGGILKGKAETQFSFGDFGIAQPRVAAVLSVDDKIRLETDLALQRSPN